MSCYVERSETIFVVGFFCRRKEGWPFPIGVMAGGFIIVTTLSTYINKKFFLITLYRP